MQHLLYVPAPLYEVLYVCVRHGAHASQAGEVPREVPGGRTGSDNCELGSETGLTGVW